MSGRFIPMLAILMTLATVIVAVRGLREDGADAWRQTESQIDRSLHNYFDREMRLCQF